MFLCFFMPEFNPDGSLKLPGYLKDKMQKENTRITNYRCAKVKKELVSMKAPKSCLLHVKLSSAINDNRFVETIYKGFYSRVETPSKLIKISEKEFDVELGTSFRRCSDCRSLIGSLRDFLDGNLIEEKGSCYYEPRQFAFEDYFD